MWEQVIVNVWGTTMNCEGERNFGSDGRNRASRKYQEVLERQKKAILSHPVLLLVLLMSFHQPATSTKKPQQRKCAHLNSRLIPSFMMHNPNSLHVHVPLDLQPTKDLFNPDAAVNDISTSEDLDFLFDFPLPFTQALPNPHERHAAEALEKFGGGTSKSGHSK
jgi:hypothetical protein